MGGHLTSGAYCSAAARPTGASAEPSQVLQRRERRLQHRGGPPLSGGPGPSVRHLRSRSPVCPGLWFCQALRERVPRHGGRGRHQLLGPLWPGLGGGCDRAVRHHHPCQKRFLLDVAGDFAQSLAHPSSNLSKEYYNVLPMIRSNILDRPHLSY